MDWYIENQVQQALKQPGIFLAEIIVFSFIAGERLTELVGAKAPDFYDYFFAALFVVLPIWLAYIIARAIRKLRCEKELDSAYRKFLEADPSSTPRF